MKHNRHPRMHIPMTGSTGNGTGGTSPMSNNIIITGWLSTRDQLHTDIRSYWSYRDDMAVIDGMVMKGQVHNCAMRPTRASIGPTSY